MRTFFVGLLLSLSSISVNADLVGLNCTIRGAGGNFKSSLVLDMDAGVAEYSDQTGSEYTNLELKIAPSQITLNIPHSYTTIYRISRRDLSMVRYTKIVIQGIMNEETEQPGQCEKVDVVIDTLI